MKQNFLKLFSATMAKLIYARREVWSQHWFRNSMSKTCFLDDLPPLKKLKCFTRSFSKTVDDFYYKWFFNTFYFTVECEQWVYLTTILVRNRKWRNASQLNRNQSLNLKMKLKNDLRVIRITLIYDKFNYDSRFTQGVHILS